VIYQYTGPKFTTAVPPYTTSDFVSASFQLPTALGANLTGVEVCSAIVSPTPCTTPFNISDGVETLTNANSSLSFFASISTNAGGIPTQWEFSGKVNVGFIQINSFAASVPGLLNEDFVQPPPGESVAAFVDTTPGPQYWSVVPVPEPSTLTLSAIGLLLLAEANPRRRA